MEVKVEVETEVVLMVVETEVVLMVVEDMVEMGGLHNK